ncbi:Gfo/Idh/MocA family protein [Puia dinghuensis]|uniref:Alpha-N-acetylgalactosaminidase n=1 Tax=Puia dinghuensis TaxID=1792502 RepID=A0A8J2XVN6_9BACT|nr:Gfo/Idh/MocA family oxidoreductase [Puia dinghuensis]GGB17689.1 alpha-N-acetylgalactosaminidase [Puia dinghuensis]
MNRKTFLRNSSMAALALATTPTAQALPRNTPVSTPQKDTPLHFEGPKVRLAIIGTGLRGQSHLHLLLRRDDVDLIAICDIDDYMLSRARSLVTKSGKKMPQVYTGSPYAWQDMLKQQQLDGVIIATPWEWHKPMIVGSLEAGVKYVATEVILGITLQDHWDVVKAAEKYNAHVMMLENVCYRRNVMAVLNMVRQGLFGEIIHLQGGYQHNLQGIKFNNGQPGGGAGCEFGEKAFSEARWRTEHSVHRNGDLYPTHGIGPLAHYIDINRGNLFTTLCSFSTKSRGLHDYVVRHCGNDHPSAKVRFKLGDVVTTSINCANGETILLQHDTNLPRPYSLGFRVQGTNGLWMDVAGGIYVEGQSAKEDEWDAAKTWLDKYDHPLWKRWNNEAEGAGHGGMDFFVIHAFIESIKRKTPTPQDVYDAAAWSAITPLSEQSIELGNITVPFPDFTGGQWMYRKQTFALSDEY